MSLLIPEFFLVVIVNGVATMPVDQPATYEECLERGQSLVNEAIDTAEENQDKVRVGYICAQGRVLDQSIKQYSGEGIKL